MDPVTTINKAINPLYSPGSIFDVESQTKEENEFAKKNADSKITTIRASETTIYCQKQGVSERED